MLADFLRYLYENYDISWLRVVNYITFRAVAGGGTALAFSFLIGPTLISFLKKKVIEPIKEEAPEEHKNKKDVPTMGGILIISSTVLSAVLWCDWGNSSVWILLVAILWMALVGFIDDYQKVIKKVKTGIKEQYKLIGQVLLGILISVYTISNPDLSILLSQTTIPFFKNVVVDYGYWYIPVCVFIITAVSNSMNLTDGLDGLAVGTAVISLLLLTGFAYLTGNIIYAEYLNIVHVSEASEVGIFAFILAAACIGFLWFNASPAQIFMGDTGSLSIGSAVAVISLLIKKELLLPLIAGVFMIETISVIVQRVVFKYTRIRYGKGKRVFKMAPLHHHFQLKGWKEQKIVIRFWIIGIIFGLMSLITLKLR